MDTLHEGEETTRILLDGVSREFRGRRVSSCVVDLEQKGSNNDLEKLVRTQLNSPQYWLECVRNRMLCFTNRDPTWRVLSEDRVGGDVK